MKRAEYLTLITDSLGVLSYQVEYRNSINLYDINIVAEDFFRDFLNLVYDYKLINLNSIDKNTSSIDLGDKESSLSIQVTSDNSSTKIKKTIDKFNENNLYKQYKRLVILILTQKKKYTATFSTEGKFSFDKKSDVWDFKKIISDIRDLDIEKLKLIADFLDMEMNRVVSNQIHVQSSEVETIVDLIEYLSTNKKFRKNEKNTIVDPDHKINTRFKEYADFLKKLYMKLVSIYGSSVSEANLTLGLDEIKEMVIGTYLMDISDKYLKASNENPQLALEKLTDFFSEELGKSGKKYDKMAIKYYLISQTIRCNVFPIIEGE
jgi:hypothetical protein